MSAELLLREFERLDEVPDAVEILRGLLIEVALRGDLTSSTPERLTGEPVDLEHVYRGMQALVGARTRYRWTEPKRDSEAESDLLISSWRSTELGNTGLYVNGIAFKPADWGSTGRPIIRIQNLSGMSGEYNHTEGEFPEDNLVEAGDLLVSWSATLDTFLWDGPQGVVNQHIFKVIPNEHAVTPAFLYWLLKHEVRALAKSQHAHGLAMMHINRGPFLAHRVLLPPLPEQRCIVAKVEELMTLCDQLELVQQERELQRTALRGAALHRLASVESPTDSSMNVRFFLKKSPRLITRAEHISELRQTILALAVRGRLVPQDAEEEPASAVLERVHKQKMASGLETGRDWVGSTVTPEDAEFRLPLGWAWSRIGTAVQRVTVGYVGSMTSQYVPGGVPFLRSQNVRADRFRWEGLIAIRPEFHQTILKSSLAPGDVVIVRSGNVGTACVVPEELSEANCSDLVIAKNPMAVLPRFLSFYLNSLASAHIEAGTVGMALTHFNTKSVATMPIPLPPLDEQRRIVAKVDELMAMCDQLETALCLLQDERGRLLIALVHDALGELPKAVEDDLHDVKEGKRSSDHYGVRRPSI
jgi:type I restriction enzyme S subunit